MIFKKSAKLMPTTSSPSFEPYTESSYNSSHSSFSSDEDDQYSTSDSFGFYGHEHISLLTTQNITDTFGCSTDPETSFILLHPQLPFFIAETIYATNLPYSVITAALVLLQHPHKRFDKKSKLTNSGHRLFLASYIIAAKEQDKRATIHNDNYWSRLTCYPITDIMEMQQQLKGIIGLSNRRNNGLEHQAILNAMKKHSGELSTRESSALRHTLARSNSSESISLYSEESSPLSQSSQKKKGNPVKLGIRNFFKRRPLLLRKGGSFRL